MSSGENIYDVNNSFLERFLHLNKAENMMKQTATNERLGCNFIIC